MIVFNSRPSIKVMKGQVAYEYLAMISIVLVLLAPVSFYAFNASSTQKAFNEGELAVSKISTAAEFVYYQGEGAKQTVEVNIPESSNLEESYISNGFVVLRLEVGEGGEIVRAFPFNVSGGWPNSTGVKTIEIEMVSGNITIEASG